MPQLGLTVGLQGQFALEVALAANTSGTVFALTAAIYNFTCRFLWAANAKKSMFQAVLDFFFICDTYIGQECDWRA